MARPSNAPRYGEVQEFFLNLYADVAFDLHLYCEVLGAQKTKLINRAVRDLIDRELEENRGIRLRFDELKALRVEEAQRRREANNADLRVVRRSQPSASQRRGQRRPKRDQ